MNSPLAPGFLIAVPHLLDPNFRQSVVLLLQQDDEGAMGIIINRDSGLLLSDLCRDHDIAYAGDAGKRVRMGGPVQPEQGLVLYGPEHCEFAGQAVIDGLSVSASTETLTSLCRLNEGRFECYSGYAGWGPKQLEREIREGSWIIGSPNPALVLDTPPDEIWQRSLNDLGIDPALLVPGSMEEA